MEYSEVKRLEGKNVIIMIDDFSECDIIRIISAEMYPDILVEDENGYRGIVPVEWLTTI